ncbi:hypothetical protein C8Q80DRAFT_209001 [Daedaleopsis nitida]|nr:hypothetical protein C8Q80DRAFT_209001 [Daedaleopsis nitida]
MTTLNEPPCCGHHASDITHAEVPYRIPSLRDTSLVRTLTAFMPRSMQVVPTYQFEQRAGSSERFAETGCSPRCRADPDRAELQGSSAASLASARTSRPFLHHRTLSGGLGAKAPFKFLGHARTGSNAHNSIDIVYRGLPDSLRNMAGVRMASGSRRVSGIGLALSVPVRGAPPRGEQESAARVCDICRRLGRSRRWKQLG